MYLTENQIEQILKEVKRRIINEDFYYHGTSAKNANGIVRNGLNSNMASERIGGNGSGDFESAQGRSYMTSDPGNALRYALMSDGNDDVHVFDFNTSYNNPQAGFDEDEVGRYIYLYLNGKINNLGFNKNYLNLLTPEELQGIKRGEFKYYTAAKKIIDKITQDEKAQMYNARDNNNNFVFNNLTVKGNMQPQNHYTVKRPTPEQYQEMTNYQKYGNGVMDNLRNYYFKNRKRVN